jgi:hypothetical protein
LSTFFLDPRLSIPSLYHWLLTSDMFLKDTSKVQFSNKKLWIQSHCRQLYPDVLLVRRRQWHPLQPPIHVMLTFMKQCQPMSLSENTF